MCKLTEALTMFSALDGTVTAILEMRDGTERTIEGSYDSVYAQLRELEASEVREQVKAVRSSHKPITPS